MANIYFFFSPILSLLACFLSPCGLMKIPRGYQIPVEAFPPPLHLPSYPALDFSCFFCCFDASVVGHGEGLMVMVVMVGMWKSVDGSVT